MLKLLRRAVFWIRARRHADDLVAELEDHRSHTQAALEAGGLTPAEAGIASRRTMGNVALAREDARDVWMAASLGRVWRDAVYGARALRREPTFTVTALLALTVGIAATTTMFSIADAELWKPLPFPDAQRLVATRATRDGRYVGLTVADLSEWRSRSRLARYAAMIGTERRVLRLEGAESVTTRPITTDLFDMLGVRPAIGRSFGPGDEHGARVALLSDTGWTRLFNRAPSALGQSIVIDDEPYTIVGITAGTRFEFIRDPDFFVALDATSAKSSESPSGFYIYGRLQPGVAIGEAQAELQSFATDRTDRTLTVLGLQEDASGYNWRTLYFFLGAAGVLLLLSGLNVAGLLLARALRRRREFAIRGALGGGLGSLVRQVVVEGALLAIPASAAGLTAAAWLLRVLTVSIPPGQLERGGHLDVDVRSAAFVLALGVATTIGLAVTPLFFARRIDLNVTLAPGGRAIGPSRRQRSVRSALLTAQVTVTVVLLTAATLFAVSLYRTIHAPLGFQPADRIALRLTLSGARYATDAPVTAFASRLLEETRSIGGVRQIAVGSASPLGGDGVSLRVVVADRPRPARGKEPTALVRAVTTTYFSTLDIPLLAGRNFTAADTAGAPRVAVVNELLARTLFPGENAIGRPLEMIPRPNADWTNRPGAVVIVGVVADVRNFFVNEVAFSTVYLPFPQAPAPAFELITHSAFPASDVLPSLRATLTRLDPAVPLTKTETLDDRVADTRRGDRFHLVVVAFFATAATLLAAIGIYGAMACSVEERTREFGIRIALGAQARGIVAAALSTALRVAVTGGIAGVALALLLARLVGDALYLVPGQHGGLLYGVKTTDPLALGSAAVTLMLVTIGAGLIPARQAVRVDPAVALRSE